jgi:ribonuclease M5
MSKQVLVVVEGTHDESHLKQLYPNIHTISVGGSAVSEDVLQFLQVQEAHFDIVLLLDPDHAGERIRRIIASRLQQPKHVFLSKEVATNGKKVGVEHADKAYLDEAFQYEITSNETNTLTVRDMVELSLTGTHNSKQQRQAIAAHFHLGAPNHKTLLKRLNMLGVTKQQLKEILNATSI